MKKENIKEILEKVNSGNHTPEEERTAKLWLFQLNNDEELQLSEDKLNRASKRMWAAIEVDARGKTPKKTASLWPKIAIAATLAVVLFGAGLFYFNRQKSLDHPAQNNISSADINPGKSGATLTLANGKKIRLSDVATGEITKDAGVAISKSADGKLVYEIQSSSAEMNKINTLSTANGETYQIKLPDGSLVWLNAASTLTYTPALTKGGQRKVKLTGEAYFQVAKDKSHPFIVESRGQEVEVLGTHFNVNAYADETAIATTLLEGAVKISTGSGQKILKPGEQALYKEGSIKVSTANLEKVTDWKDGDFYLNHIHFKIAMRKIARWYDLEVIYDPDLPEDLETGGWISRNNKLSVVLKLIESSGQVRFKVRGKKLFVSKPPNYSPSN